MNLNLHKTDLRTFTNQKGDIKMFTLRLLRKGIEREMPPLTKKYHFYYEK